MKYLLITAALTAFSFLSQFALAGETTKALTQETQIIADRLASKNISQVLQIVLKLQLECQQFGGDDVCEGVLNVLDVIRYRLDIEYETMSEETLAFIEGLIEGVVHANKKAHARVNDIGLVK